MRREEYWVSFMVVMRCGLVTIAKVKARDSIPNSRVKPFSADGTANVWESRTLPGHIGSPE